MTQFRTDNTEGFSASELDAMNAEYDHDMAECVADLPRGAVGAPGSELDQISQGVAESVLKRHGGA